MMLDGTTNLLSTVSLKLMMIWPRSMSKLKCLSNGGFTSSTRLDAMMASVGGTCETLLPFMS